jgi:acetyltransferase-like isoleucine patch superfamily enzyme
MNAEQARTESGTTLAAKPTLRRRLATSEGRLARFLRWSHRSIIGISVPAPKVVVKPALWVLVSVRSAYHFGLRIFICEPIFKAYCTKYGKNLHTGCFIHWISGKGNILVGDNVTVDGKCSITFAARFSDSPTLEIGDDTGVGHGCSFTIGKRITVGRNCTLSGDIEIIDSNAHDTDPAARLARRPPQTDDVRPVTIGDGVWIGRKCLIFPGVKIGEGSVIAAGSIVRNHVPAFSVVAGNPAKVMFRLKRPEQTTQAK